MSLYKRGGTWHYDFALDGNRFRGSTKELTLSRARKMESLLIAEARDRGNTILNRKIPILSDFSIRFFQWVEASPLEPKSKLYYREGWQIIRKTELTGMRLDRIGKDEVESINFPGSPSNVNRAIRTVRRMLGKAEEWKIIRNAPKIKLAKEYGRSGIIDTHSEAKLISVASQPLKDVLAVMLDTGMRPQEVFCMRCEDINWESQTIFIPSGKTRNSRRFVPMTQRVRIALAKRIGEKKQGWVFESESESGHLTTVKKAFQTARTKAGLSSSIVLYSARHTFATNVLAATGNLAVVMKAMGHSNAQTAMIYQHPNLDSVREAMDSRNETAQRHKTRHKAVTVISKAAANQLRRLVAVCGLEPQTYGL